MRNLILTVSVSFYLFSNLLYAQINSTTSVYPFGSNTSYAYGIMPNNLPTTGTYGQSTAVGTAYNTWKTSFTQNCTSGQVRVLFDNTAETVSEGIGYGMLLAAYAADKTLFDGLWKYYKTNLVTSGHGLMNWKINGCSGTTGTGGATDGDLDAAMALIVASYQWPSFTSPYIYSTEATSLITAIKTWEIHPTSYQTINGDGWGFGSTCRNPSYFAPAYYREFGIFVPSQQTFWNSAVTASNTLLNANVNSTNGLVSNWSDNNGIPNTCNGAQDFGYDACRNPWRMGVDVLWNGSSTAATSASICSKLASFTNGKATTMSGPLPLNSTNAAAGSYHNAVFVSMFSPAVMGTSSTYQSHLNTCYTETRDVEPAASYFGSTLRMISLFVLTGNFWKPSSVVASVDLAVENNYNFSLWPNPSRSEFNIDVSSISSLRKIRLVDALGVVVWEEVYTSTPSEIIRIKTSFKTGLYQLLVTSEKNTYYSKLIIE